MGLRIELLPILGDNYCYLLFESEAGISAVVDPGTDAPVAARLESLGRGLDWILITHHHGDHTAGIAGLKQRFGCRVAGPAAEAARIGGLDLELAEGDRLTLGAETAEIIATPGHTLGHISYHFPKSRALFCGDTLFALGCGRLIEGDAAMMWASLLKLMALDDATEVYCGHEYTESNACFALTIEPGNAALRRRAEEIGGLRAAGKPTIPSTVGLERATNPFTRAADAADFARIRTLKDRF